MEQQLRQFERDLDLTDKKYQNTIEQYERKIKELNGVIAY